MDEPLIWNSLDDAAGWLAQATGKTWTVRAVLDAEIRRVKSITRNGEIPRACIKAVLPRGTSFGWYRFEKGRYVRERESGWSGPVPMGLVHLHELLLHATTRVGLVQAHGEEDEERGHIFIDPIDEEHIVDLKMAGIRGDDLKSLLDFILQKETKKQEVEEKPLKPSERDSLLKILIGIAVRRYDYDPNAKKNDAISMIVRDVGLAGITISDDTVRNYLKEAAKKLPPDPEK